MNMKKIKIGILAIILAGSTLTIQSCFNLDEEVFSEVT